MTLVGQVASVAAQMGIDTGFVWQVFLTDSQVVAADSYIVGL